MTIESDIKKIADSLERIANVLEQSTPPTQEPVVPETPIVPFTNAPTQTSQLTPPPVKTNNTPPLQPTLEPVTQVPFSNVAELVGYVLEKYKTLGPKKGAGIQGVLSSLGYANINDVKPEHFAAFFSKVEAL